MSDFTGERLVPGEVDPDLWNEHISRYFFAAALADEGCRILDAGCGTGYGASLLNRRRSAGVLGIDLSPDAITHAQREYGSAGVHFAVGRCEALPVADSSITLITAFEVIEHLEGWREFLLESRRSLTAHGLLLVSTPNKAVYAESRAGSGPNPFHVHEFDYNEFARELSLVFRFVTIFGQNHTGTITLTALGEPGIMAQRESLHVDPENAGYLVAVCGQQELPHIPNFVFVPEAANTLMERDRHIHLLREEVAAANHEFTTLLERHRAQISEVERSNEWAKALNTQVQAAGERIEDLQAELARSNAWADQLNGELKKSAARVEELQAEVANSNAWALELQASLETMPARVLELQAEVADKNAWAASLSAESEARGARVVALQQELEDRTRWAKALDARLQELEGSRWVKIGKTLRVGPLAE